MHVWKLGVTRGRPPSPLCGVEYAAGRLRPQVGRAGGEEDEQLLHHRADVRGRHQCQRENQGTAGEMPKETSLHAVIMRALAEFRHQLLITAG